MVGHPLRVVGLILPLFFRHGRSLLPEQQVHHPATKNMWPGASTVAQDVLVRAAGIFEGIGQDRETIKGMVGVDGLDEGNDGGAKPGRFQGDWAERVSEKLSEEWRGLARWQNS